MVRMELKEGTRVFTSDGKEMGIIHRFVLDPVTNEVTHIVVEKGWFLPEDKVVPFEMVNAATDDKVVLSENMESFDQLPSFEESHYIRARDADVGRSRDSRFLTDERGEISPLDMTHGEQSMEADVSRERDPRFRSNPVYHWYPPRRYMDYSVGVYGWPPVETTRNIPGHTIPLKEGTDVMSSDGEHIGDMERLVVAADSNKATHFVISQGLFFKNRKLIPAHWIETVDEDKVELAVSSKRLEDLPAYEPQ